MPARWSRDYLADGVAGAGRGAGGDAPRALRAGGPLAVRSGRGLAGGGDRAARRHLREVLAPGARACPRSWPPRRSNWACGWPTSWAWSACWPSSCSRPSTARCWSTSWRCARTTPGTGPWTARCTSQFEQHLRAVLDYPLGDTARDRAGDGDGQRAGAPQTPAMAMDERLHHLFGRMPEAQGAPVRQGRAARAARSATSTSSGSDRSDVERACVNAPSGRHTGCRTQQWTDGWDGHA